MGTLNKVIKKGSENQPLCNLDCVEVLLLGMESQLKLDTCRACDFICKRCQDKDYRCENVKCQYINDLVKALNW